MKRTPSSRQWRKSSSTAAMVLDEFGIVVVIVVERGVVVHTEKGDGLSRRVLNDSRIDVERCLVQHGGTLLVALCKVVAHR